MEVCDETFHTYTHRFSIVFSFLIVFLLILLSSAEVKSQVACDGPNPFDLPLVYSYTSDCDSAQAGTMLISGNITPIADWPCGRPNPGQSIWIWVERTCVDELSELPSQCGGAVWCSQPIRLRYWDGQSWVNNAADPNGNFDLSILSAL